ncbi:MAG: alpha/beta hydrolase [Methanomicrobiales archaeon]|nr:alpha/beta hydrolase [Methanomicrobiales archaeon]
MTPAIRYAEVNDITLAWQERGSGAPLILINGLASTMDTWNPPLLDALAKEYHVIVFDNRGTGYSTDSGKPFSIPLFAKDADALMENLGIRRAHVLGLSMGASIAQELVLEHPERVDHLILLAGTCGGREGIPARPDIWAKLTDRSGTVPEIIARMVSLLFPAPWLATHDAMKYCPEVNETTSEKNGARQADAFRSWQGSWDRLPRIHRPTLVITGTEDVIIDPKNSRILARQIPGARLVEVPGAGHGLQYQEPEHLARAVLAFLGRTIRYKG